MWDIAIFIINKIKEAIESVKTSLEEVKTNTAGNTTASASGTLSQKLTHIIELLTVGSVKEEFETLKYQTTAGNISMIKSIQRGSIDNLSTSSGEDLIITINEVNPNKSFVVLDVPNSMVTGNNYCFVTLKELTSTTLTLRKDSIGNAMNMVDVSWQVIEFY